MISMSQETITIRIKAYEIKALIRSKIKPINLDAHKLSNQKDSICAMKVRMGLKDISLKTFCNHAINQWSSVLRRNQ
jgi:hypothetical protein